MRIFVFDVHLRIIRPERPGLRTQVDYRVQAADAAGATAKAEANARRDGFEVLGPLGSPIKRWMVKGGLLG